MCRNGNPFTRDTENRGIATHDRRACVAHVFYEICVALIASVRKRVEINDDICSNVYLESPDLSKETVSRIRKDDDDGRTSRQDECNVTYVTHTWRSATKCRRDSRSARSAVSSHRQSRVTRLSRFLSRLTHMRVVCLPLIVSPPPSSSSRARLASNPVYRCAVHIPC